MPTHSTIHPIVFSGANHVSAYGRPALHLSFYFPTFVSIYVSYSN